MKYLFYIGVAQVIISFGEFLFHNNYKLSAQDSSTGDFVTGTVLKNSHAFAFQLLILFLFFSLNYTNTIKYQKWGAIFFIFSVILTSANLLSLVFVISLFLSFLWIKPKVKINNKWGKFFIAPSACILFILFSQGKNKEYVYNGIRQLDVAYQNSFRNFAKVNSFFSLYERGQRDYPEIFFTGLGLGHFSSRAAMIFTNEYLDSDLKTVSMSEMTRILIYPYWNHDVKKHTDHQGVHYDGVLYQPFSGWLSLAGETGVFGMLIFTIFFLIPFFLSKTRFKTPFQKTAMLFFLVSLGLDNWIEYPRISVLVFLLLLIGDKTSETISTKEESLQLQSSME